MSFGGAADDYELSSGYGFAADAIASERAGFIRRTYAHLLTAILIFCGIEGLFLTVEPIRNALLALIGGNWWIALILFMGASWIAQKWAHSDASSPGKQYLGLALYVVAEALIFVPLLTYASLIDGNIIPMAGLITAVIFGGLTAAVFVSGADFSFLRGALSIGMFAALGLIVAGLLFGFSLGLWFSVGMIVLLSGYILYDTSNVLHHYHTNQHVAASLALFASVATLFFYVVRLLSIMSDD
ncbi:Bax inhibitor-1/YccA family protein [Alienimonas californiensis]|uniref:Modulator of FtsH protease YccA n=1 Tax=Alienimonas californiensis TaxID=2527989 RepID=A0A517PDC1_9PLAN|nr:Bax inhibitor-1 family protein [Alienimonas californiensis]QDT17369.1 Modulator of FtsH protease YccA [Alienimonas californiensis]